MIIKNLSLEVGCFLDSSQSIVQITRRRTTDDLLPRHSIISHYVVQRRCVVPCNDNYLKVRRALHNWACPPIWYPKKPHHISQRESQFHECCGPIIRAPPFLERFHQTLLSQGCRFCSLFQSVVVLVNNVDWSVGLPFHLR